MSNLLAIDPGSAKSAVVLYSTRERRPLQWVWHDNETLRDWLLMGWHQLAVKGHLVIEYPKPRGMPTSKDEMDTLFEAGRLVQAWGRAWSPVYRQDVKLALCGHATAKDANIKQAIIDRFGGDAKAIGGVRCQKCKGKGWTGRKHDPCPEWEVAPGPLYEFSKAGMGTHGWSALALALTWIERNGK